ncbi:hypothetical protein [Bacillus sp. FSL W8-0848]|uniref:hypothetical protein n=1 Tax=Bacillus sp. FSL W8-0848 TaxID=2954634 RepID=UPI0030FA7C5B
MRRIQLTDGMPSNITKNELKQETLELLKAVIKECSKSGLSYVEINKALHLADEELYKSVIFGQIPSTERETKDGISQEKLEWMKKAGIKAFEKPMKFYSAFHENLFSEDYIKNTPLEEIKAGYESMQVPR